jgi:copper chaperone CopZ
MDRLNAHRGMSASGRRSDDSGHHSGRTTDGALSGGPGRALLALLLASGLSAPAWAGSSATRIELLLLGMDCGLCVNGLEQRLRSLPGAQQVHLDLERGQASLQVRPGSTVTDQTLRSLMRDAGIVVRRIRRSPVTP